MPDYTLRGPDGDMVVTGDGSERARLAAQGYTEREQPKQEPAAVDLRPAVKLAESKTQTKA